MFRYEHHQRISKLLELFNTDLLLESKCYFGGGTAIVLALGEYRRSDDVDFLCASRNGHRLLRNTVVGDGLGSLMRQPIDYVRDVRSDRYGIRTVVKIDGQPIKLEIVFEDRIDLSPPDLSTFNVPSLSRTDIYAEKLLANADRGLDLSVRSRDIIDLAMMINSWGSIPAEAHSKARSAYGNHLDDKFKKAVALVADKQYLLGCLISMQMDPALLIPIQVALGIAPAPEAGPEGKRR